MKKEHSIAAAVRRIIAPALSGECRIEVTGDASATFIVVHPLKCDAPKFIGKAGKNFAALKAIIEYAAPDRQTWRFVVGDSVPSGPAESTPADREHWRPDAVQAALTAYLELIGEPTAVKAERRPDNEWMFMTAAAESMPEPVYSSLSWWITVMSLSTGGYASLEIYSLATATPA